MRFTANNRVHNGSSFFLGKESLHRLANYVRFAGEADSAKLDRASRMSPTDPKRTSSSGFQRVLDTHTRPLKLHNLLSHTGDSVL
jgi:hypothetical protein